MLVKFVNLPLLYNLGLLESLYNRSALAKVVTKKICTAVFSGSQCSTSDQQMPTFQVTELIDFAQQVVHLQPTVYTYFITARLTSE